MKIKTIEMKLREVDVKRGDMVIVRTQNQFDPRTGITKSLSFGIFEKMAIVNEEFEVGGVKYTYSPGVGTRNNKLFVLRDPICLRPGSLKYNLPDYVPSTNSRLGTTDVVAYELRMGTEFTTKRKNVLEFLEGLEGFELHHNWISKLRKSYIKE